MNLIDKKYMYRFYADEFSLEKITYFKVKKLWKKEGEKLTRLFFHNLISDWITNNYVEEDRFLVNLKKYIRKSQIRLNDFEQDQLLTIEERIFSKQRHIKLLLVNINLDKGEQAGAKFTDAILYKNEAFCDQGNVIFTNKRIIIEGHKNYNFYYDKLQIISGTDKGLFIRELDDFLITIHDQKTLANTFYNLYNKKVAKLV